MISKSDTLSDLPVKINATAIDLSKGAIAYIFGRATTPDAGTAEVNQFTRDSQAGMANYYKTLCDQGDRNGCQKYQEATQPGH